MESFLLDLATPHQTPCKSSVTRRMEPRRPALSALHALILIAACCVFTPAWAQSNPGAGILREVYSGIPGSTLFELTNAPSFPNRPSSTNVIRDFFEAPVDFEDDYGQRLRGFLLPPITGEYVFWIASDDQSALFLSSNDDPGRRTPIAGVEFWTSYREWDAEPGQQSPPIRLEAGRRYYIEALMKEGSGGDHLSVRWRMPDGRMEEPIPASRLLPFGSALVPPRIRTQPASITAIEGDSAIFRVELSNLTPATYRWERNRIPIPGAEGPSYTNSLVSLADHQAVYRVVVANSEGSVTSADATLTVIPDTTPPKVRSVINLGIDRLQIRFSEPALGASRASAYRLNHEASVLSATLDADGRTAILSTTPLALRSSYTIQVSGITDAAAARNPIAPNTTFEFSVIELTPADIGPPQGDASMAAAPGGFTATAGGRGLGGTADQFLFSYQERTGDFDIQVRVESLTLTDPWAKAGIAARETLDPNSRFAATLSTPGVNGSSFSFRINPGAAATQQGFHPVNPPETWLRLRRTGNQFSGFASLNGQSWSLLGQTVIPMTNRVYLGLAVTSQNTNRLTKAEFRDFRTVTDAVPERASFSSVREIPGPSSRNTSLVITEIMYRPIERTDGKVGDFVELYNSGPVRVDVGGYKLAGSINYTFPNDTSLEAGELVVVAPRPDDVKAIYGFSQAKGGFNSRLNNRSGSVRLLHRNGAILLEALYDSNPPYPPTADGAGHSLILAYPSYGERDPRAWAASSFIGGSPGTHEIERQDDGAALRINEILAHTDEPQVDFVELFNHSPQIADLSGWILTDQPGVPRFRIPQGTRISPGGFAVFTQNLLGFALNAAGETLYLYTPEMNRIADAVRFGPQLNGVASGRYPNGSGSWTLLSTPSPAAANPARAISSVVIGEINYHPLNGDRRESFIELMNHGTDNADLSSWRIEGGIQFSFPSGTTLAPGTALAVAKDAPYLQSIFTNLNSTNLVGNFSGNLSFRSDRIILSRPESIVSTNNAGAFVTNRVFVPVDVVEYFGGGRWNSAADGEGSSLERLDPRADPQHPATWTASDERFRGEWTPISVTGVLDLGSTAFQADNIQILLMGSGECLVDNVEVLTPSQPNFVSNGDFEAGLTLWTARGTHATSRISPEGFKSSRSLRLVASARGDTGPNQVLGTLRAAVPAGSTTTIRAQVRWLSGNPEILFRLHGNGLEAAGRMKVPPGAGTPGQINIHPTSNLGPSIDQVSHHPPLPATGESVRITARIADPDQVQSVRLLYRLDPSISILSTNLVDTGTQGDEVQGDGIYSVMIQGQAAGVILAYSIEASDNALEIAKSKFPSDAPNRECLVMFGGQRPPGGLGNYHVWITQATEDLWIDRGPGSNDSFDATFVDGQGRIIYNMRTLYSGSPFHWRGYSGPLGGNCNYLLQFPEDDPFLGVRDFVLNSPSNLGNDNTAQREQTFYWAAAELGQPVTHRRQHRLYLNGFQRGSAASAFLFEDAQQPNGDFVETWFPDDSKGELYKIEDWFEYDAGAFGFSNLDASLQLFQTTGGAKKLERYRWGWRKRSVDTGESAHDYSQLFELVDAVNEPSNAAYTERVERLVDVQQWMTAFALRHAVGDWDAYGYRRGKNMYAYKSPQGRWQLLHWDIAFGLGQGDGPTTDLFSTIEPTVRRMFQHPPFRRLYFQAFQRIVDGPFNPEKLDPILDERHAALTGAGLGIATPNSIRSYIRSRRNFISQTLSSNQAPFEVSSLPENSSTNRSLIEITGTAPIQVSEILINGVTHPARWLTVNRWSILAALQPGSNALTFTARDLAGELNPTIQHTVSIHYDGPPDTSNLSPVINEIQWDDSAPGGEFLELFNPSPTRAYDLSGWTIQGAEVEFPNSTILQPLGFLVIPRDAQQMRNAFGTQLPLASELGARLSRNGMVLRLVKPGTEPANASIIDAVRYETRYPWPTSSSEGASFQRTSTDSPGLGMIPAGWGVVDNQALSASEWTYVSVSGSPSGSTLIVQLAKEGEVLLDDLNLVEGPVPGVGPNLIPNAGFESAISWQFDSPYSSSTSENIDAIEGSKSFRLAASSPPSELQSARLNLVRALKPGVLHTLSFWYKPVRGGSKLTLRFENQSLTTTAELSQASLPLSTPGSPNNLSQISTSLPSLALNEVLPVNTAGITDASGTRRGWFEILNTGTISLNLNRFFVKWIQAGSESNGQNPASAPEWDLPQVELGPGRFQIIWFGGSSPGQIHSPFVPSNTGGRLLLGARNSTTTGMIFDWIDFPALPANQSFGHLPDGTPLASVPLSIPTPGQSNSQSPPRAGLVINEWLASNAGSVTDPADGDFDDWFELYNPTSQAIDLSGYHVTDVLTNFSKWTLPAGTTIPAGGFLTIWADEETGQNADGRGIHANFKISAQGEELALFDPTGLLIDAVRFGPQKTDVSQGRFPDGAPEPFREFPSPTPSAPNRVVIPGGSIQILEIRQEPAGISITFASEPGRSYRLESADEVQNAPWRSVGDPATASNPRTLLRDPRGAAGGKRFYRIARD